MAIQTILLYTANAPRMVEDLAQMDALLNTGWTFVTAIPLRTEEQQTLLIFHKRPDVDDILRALPQTREQAYTKLAEEIELGRITLNNPPRP